MPLVRSEFFWRPPPGGPVETVFLVTDLGDYIVDDLGNYIVAVAGDQTEPPAPTAIFLLLLSGDQQTGTDRLLLSGDQQTGADGLLLSGDQTEPPSAPAQSWDDDTLFDDGFGWTDD